MSVRLTGVMVMAMLTGAGMLMRSVNAGGDLPPAVGDARSEAAPIQSSELVDAGVSTSAAAVSDKPLEAYQVELLEVAFGAASAMPLKPHIRNRSRAQESVVAACFALDQPQRALGYVERIDNWLRGSGYADYAQYCAQHGATCDLQRYLDLAAAIVQREEDWRRDTVRVKIAQTYVWLGQTDRAAQFEAGVVASEMGKVEAAKAMTISADNFDEQVNALNALIATGQFDQMKNAAEACTQLFNRFYADETRRSSVERTIRATWSQLPTVVRIELMMTMAGFSRDHGDQAKALEFINDAQANLDGHQWLAKDRIPMTARLARQRYLAGDKEKGRSDVDSALAQFDAQRDTIVIIYRAEALCPIAEAYQTMGDTAAALKVYRRAVEEGVVSPNSRPRADDLSATCCSLARHGVEPDAELWTRIRQIREGLSDPW